MGRRPPKAAQLRAVNRIATVMARSVAHPVKIISITPKHPQQLAQNGQVVALAISANKVGLAHAAARKNLPHRRTVVLNVDPIANVPAVTVQLGPRPVYKVCNLAGNKLLHVLVGTVVVRAYRDGGAQAVRAHPRAQTCRQPPC